MTFIKAAKHSSQYVIFVFSRCAVVYIYCISISISCICGFSYMGQRVCFPTCNAPVHYGEQLLITSVLCFFSTAFVRYAGRGTGFKQQSVENQFPVRKPETNLSGKANVYTNGAGEINRLNIIKKLNYLIKYADMNIVFCRLNELGATNNIFYLPANKAYKSTCYEKLPF